MCLPGATVIAGAGLLWLFVYGVLAPLRKVVADVRAFSGSDKSHDGAAPRMNFGPSVFTCGT